MNKRAAVVSAVVVLALIAGGAFWLLVGERSVEQPSVSPTQTASTPSEPATSSAEEGAEVEGRPIASCAPKAPSGRIPERFWGMHSPTPIGSDYPEAPVRAMNLTTAQVYWNQIERAPGQYDFERLDQILQTSEERDAPAMLVLGFTPGFHAKDPASPTARSSMPDLKAWRSWVAAVVDRYGDQIDYQIWPEPNIVGNWEGTPAQMALLSVVAGDLIHDRAPHATVVAPATALRLGSQRRWMDRFWATSVDGRTPAEALDVVALDPFPVQDGTPEDSIDLICSAQEILDARQVGLPIWTNEINYGVPSGGNATGVVDYPDDRQAAVVARTYVLHAALGVERVYWLGWNEYPGMAVDMLRGEVTTPAGRAFILVHQWLANGSMPTCSIRAGVHRCVVRRAGVITTILWRERGEGAIRAPMRLQLKSLGGATRHLRAGDRIRIGQSPVALVQRP